MYTRTTLLFDFEQRVSFDAVHEVNVYDEKERERERTKYSKLRLELLCNISLLGNLVACSYKQREKEREGRGSAAPEGANTAELYELESSDEYKYT